MSRDVMVAALVAAVIGGGTAWADDLAPAPWRSPNHPGYTIQEWEFTQPGTPLPPDGSIPTINPGLPTLSQAVGVLWTPDFSGTGLDGYVGLTTGFLEFAVPNVIDEEPIKFIRVQINGDWTQAAFPPFINSVLAEVGLNTINGVPGPSDETFPGFHRWEEWFVEPNPDFETIQVIVPTDAFINQVVIETISFPEPASLALLGLGGLVVCRRRR